MVGAKNLLDANREELADELRVSKPDEAEDTTDPDRAVTGQTGPKTR